jgi:ABC-type nitrate/sulfonate/bicarbonate transport system permease component
MRCTACAVALRLAAGPVLALVAWEALGQALSGSYLIAPPSEVLPWIAGNAGLLWRNAQVTLAAAATGFLIGNLAAIALATLALAARRLEPLVSALALLVFCLPMVATGPILRVIFGPGTGPQVTIAALAVYYTTYVTLVVGLRAAPASWFDLVRSYGQGRIGELVHVRAFAALPYLVAGLQIAAPAALLGAIVGEFTGAERGLGVLVIQAMRSLDVTATWGLAMLSAALASLAYAGLGRIGLVLNGRGGAAPALLLAPPSSRRGGTGPGGALLLALATLMSALALWQGLMDAFDLNRFFARRPGDVWDYLVTAPDAAAHRATLLTAFGQTLVYAVPGYIAGLGLGLVLAVALTLWPALGGAVLPVAIALRSVPIVATAPLIVLALGRGATGTITVVAVMIFFPTLVACLHGLRQTPGQVLDIFDSYASGRWTRLALAQVPAMLPAFFAAARMAVPAAILAATTAEWLATGTGIGSLMAMTASTSAYGMLWGAVALTTLAAALAYAAVGLMERAVLARYAGEQLAG